MAENPSYRRVIAASFSSKWQRERKHRCRTVFLQIAQQTRPRNILPIRSSLDDEFRSSRNIAIGLHRRYRNVVKRSCGQKLREFIKAGVTAYTVGCTDEGFSARKA
jgi:hypothetical protein